MIMKGYRYNSKKREDRKFNSCGKEKNPNSLKFFGKTLEYVEDYRFIYDDNFSVIYECSLETVKITNANLFDMESNYNSLATFKKYVNDQVKVAQSNAEFFARVSGKRSNQVIDINQIKNSAKVMDFQALSDFEIQNDLVAELISLGFDGYETKNEIVLL